MNSDNYLKDFIILQDFKEVKRYLMTIYGSYYTYIFIDTKIDKPFYVGKGRGFRLFDHLRNHKSEIPLRVEDLDYLTILETISQRYL